jgi:DNA-binding HxlR family transcriptional regulator
VGRVPLGRDYEAQDCAIARALEVVGERWTLLVLRDCFFGVRRFADLRAHLDVPRAVLSDRLATLVAAGLLERRPYAPGRDEYLVTAAARPLWPVLLGLAAWGEAHTGSARRRFRHAECPAGGADVDGRGTCPACGAAPDPAELEIRPVGPPSGRDDPVSRTLRRPHRLLTPLP